jgi:hypothetical protein
VALRQAADLEDRSGKHVGDGKSSLADPGDVRRTTARSE